MECVIMVYVGLSAYSNSISGFQNTLIPFLKSKGLNCHRLAFSPAWFGTSHLRYSKSQVQYFLDNMPPSAAIIVDPNHLHPDYLPDGATYSKEYDLYYNSTNGVPNFTTAKNSVKQICADFAGNSRVIIELLNEYANKTDAPTLTQVVQEMIDDVRNAGYTNPLCMNKYAYQLWSQLATIDDNNIYFGTHRYMESRTIASPGDALTQIDDALNTYHFTKMVNTETGASNTADPDPIAGYTGYKQENMDLTAYYLEYCADRNVGNCIWNYIDTPKPAYPSPPWYMSPSYLPHNYPEFGFTFPVLPSGVTLPFHDVFGNLVNWQTVNGTWSAG